MTMTKTLSVMILSAALAASTTAPATAGWGKLKERFSNENFKKALGDKNCWELAFSFQKAKRTTCRRGN